MLTDSRARTLALMRAYVAALGPQLLVPQAPQFNLPLWELGHIAWFQDHWIARNPCRAQGARAEPYSIIQPRLPSRSVSGVNPTVSPDALYDSSAVPHAMRWQLALPDLRATEDYLQESLQHTLSLLRALEPREQALATDDDLYFFRLVLFHEDMHAEATTYMAQALGIGLPQPSLVAGTRAVAGAVGAQIHVPGQTWRMGQSGGPGFMFDNELTAHEVALPAFDIDAHAVSWRRFLPFVEAGGYTNRSGWSDAGWQWLQQSASAPLQAPRYLRRHAEGGGWERQHFGHWQALDLDAAAVHLSHFEAQAWCHWAGRCLPTEAQWECAAISQPDPHNEFIWGQVWEWTGSTFTAFPGFTPHPYRDYSEPWFGNRPVLKGASSVATSARMMHPRYRNFFTPERNDIHAGFRSCRVHSLLQA